MKRRNLIILIIAICLGSLIAITDGFGNAFIRGYVGDVISVIALATLLRLISLKDVPSIAISLGLAVGIELIQIFPLPSSLVLLVGKHIRPVGHTGVSRWRSASLYSRRHS